MVAKQYQPAASIAHRKCCVSCHGDDYRTSLPFQFLNLTSNTNWLYNMFASRNTHE